MGVDVNLRDGGLILLVVDCYMGYLSVVKELIKIGVDVNLFDGDKKIFLIFVCYGGYLNVVVELINLGVCVNLKDKKSDFNYCIMF